MLSSAQTNSPLKVAILLLVISALTLPSLSCSRKAGGGFSVWPFKKGGKAVSHPDNEVYIPPPPGELDGDGSDSPPKMVGDLEEGGAIPPVSVGHDSELLVEPTPIREETESINQLQTVFFAFDSSELNGESKTVLDENTQWLKQHPNVEIQIQGHCDEQGTVEYNFALADRRAKAVKAYLIQTGIDGAKLRTISYGEERPMQGYTTADWDMNRRVQFMVFR